MSSPVLATRSCQGVTKSGAPCEATPMSGQSWCYFHHPEHQEHAQAARLQGAAARRTPAIPEADPVQLSSSQEVLETLSLVATATIRGVLDAKRANALAVLCSTALRALDHRIEERLAELESEVANLIPGGQ